jgi:hypothetical protein
MTRILRKAPLFINAILLLWVIFEIGFNVHNCLAAGAKVSPVFYQNCIRTNPNVSLHIVVINLHDSQVTPRVSRGGPDPDGEGPWTTTLQPVSEIAEREKLDIAINGDFFTALATKDIEGHNTGYTRGKFASPEGLAMTDGRIWHRASAQRPFLAFSTNRNAAIEAGTEANSTNFAYTQIIGGGQIIVSDGNTIEFNSRFATNRHPRTAVGIDRSKTKLTLLVVDGRQPKLSVGMTLHELSQEMIRLGCDRAINLDGGGSSTLVYRDPETHRLKVLNSPSDQKERSVADILGFTVNAPMPTAN